MLMAKRPLTVEERRTSKRPTTEDTTDKVALDEIFASWLTEKVYGRRTTQVEECGVQYLVKMRLQPRPTLEGYIAHVEAAHPNAKGMLGTVWNKLKQFFSTEEGLVYEDIESMTDIQAFVTAFQGERFLNNHKPTAPELSADEAWMLPSGACVDDIVSQYVRTLNRESALHSCIIDSPTTILDLFSDPEEKAALAEVLVNREGESTKLISPAEEAYMRLYDKEPTKMKELLSQGWQVGSESQEQVPESFRESIHLALHLIYVVYRSNRFQLPENASESFFVQTLWGFISTLVQCDETLLFRPAEVHSQASSLRKNKGRRMEDASRQAVGRKVDGLILSASTLLELCAFEAARKDAAPQGTKALSDSCKLAKVMKDSFDTICDRANTDIRSHLVVYGVRIAGASITFYSLRKRRGRCYQMVKDGTVSFPAKWDDTNTITILTIVASVMALRRRVSHMAKQVGEWTTLSFELLDTSNSACIPPTLTTPPGSPRRSTLS
ncbi:hypothetical protein KVV02_001673 [Mortierella alpina]|uniref:Uncharacterized protein n=1 Tax=Mortierella alpina TaxID=64518 RepID=A0A9P8A8Q6_MORAP|nr:hypothetical protein KVV02_001673 [Mortierella alpina]